MVTLELLAAIHHHNGHQVGVQSQLPNQIQNGLPRLDGKRSLCGAIVSEKSYKYKLYGVSQLHRSMLEPPGQIVTKSRPS